MIAALAGLFICQLIGEFFVRAFALPLPGPVFGMLLLFAFLLIRGARRGHKDAEPIPKGLAAAADGLIGHLSLLFVPASVGIMRYFDLLADNFVAIAIAVAVSTAIGQAATALAFRAMTRP